VNVDSKVMDITKLNMINPTRWTFEEAGEHIFRLMKNDSYQRFLRSDVYKECLQGTKKKVSAQKALAARLPINFPGRREQTSPAATAQQLQITMIPE